MGRFTFFPFGNGAINRRDLKCENDIGTGIAGLLGNRV